MVYNTATRLRQGLCLLALLASPHLTTAGALQVHASVSSGHYTRHINLANDGPAVALAADWSADNGFFTGGECHLGSSQASSSFDRACFAYVGYFQPLGDDNALSFEARHYGYRGRDPVSWDTSEYSVSWHHQEQWLFSLTYSDDWLARRTSTLSLDAAYRYLINDSLSVTGAAGVLHPESRQRIHTVTTGSIGLEYQSERWSTELKANFIDSDSRRRLPFDIHQPELLWSVSYQLY